MSDRKNSTHLSPCALRLIKTRTQVAQEMKLPARVAEIARSTGFLIVFRRLAGEVEGDIIMTCTR